MAKMIRCQRCFALKEHEDEKCEFCGKDPKEEREIHEMFMKMELEFLEQQKQEKQEDWIDLPLEERIRKYTGMEITRPPQGLFGKKQS